MNIVASPENAAHLLRRAAWGGRPDEIERVVDIGIEAAVDELFDASLAPEVAEPAAQPGLSPYESEALAAWFVRTCATSATPAIERLTWFWHGHFATSVDKVEFVDLVARQLMTLRRLGLGRFDDLLEAMANDAAMNLWLDLHLSVAGNPNENFAREVLELFSMGAGNGYTQSDVVAAARAFTGYGLELEPTYGREVGTRLVPSLHDFGPKTFLDRTGPFDGSDIIAIVVERPECHRFLARRFWLRYAGPEPDPALVDELAAAFARRLHVRDLLTALLTNPAFYRHEVKNGLVAQPVEVMIRTVRGFDLGLPDLAAVTLADLEDDSDSDGLNPGDVHPYELADLLHLLGQIPGHPPNVGGWPHNEAWLDSNRSAGRLLAGTMLGEWLAFEGSATGDRLREAAAAGPKPLTAELMARWGRVGWSDQTESAIAAALGRAGSAADNSGHDAPDYEQDDDLGRAVAAAVAVAFTSPEVTLA